LMHPQPWSEPPFIFLSHPLRAFQSFTFLSEEIFRPSTTSLPWPGCPNCLINKCLILDHKATKKLDTRFIGPFTIIHIHVNGTLTIQCTPHIPDRVNIRQVKPYF
jgi:hypothetical protein